MIKAHMVAVVAAGPRWVDVQKRWPWLSAMREYQTTVDVMDVAVGDLVRGADTLAGLLDGDVFDRCAARAIWSFRHEQRSRARHVAALSSRQRTDKRKLLRCASEAVDDVAGLIEQIGDLHVAHRDGRSSGCSRELAHLLVDTARLVADAWTRPRIGAPIDLRLRGLARASPGPPAVRGQQRHDDAWRPQRRGDGERPRSALATLARQARAIGVMNRAVLVVLVLPRSTLCDVTSAGVDGGATVASARTASRVTPPCQAHGSDPETVSCSPSSGGRR